MRINHYLLSPTTSTTTARLLLSQEHSLSCWDIVRRRLQVYQHPRRTSRLALVAATSATGSARASAVISPTRSIRYQSTMADIKTPIPSLTLNDGTKLPMLAYGTGTAWSKRGSTAEEDVDRKLVEGIKSAIGMGYRHFDCAESYRNECDLGVALQESKLTRSEFFVTTKVMHRTDDIAAALRASLKKLQLDYVDLYLIHAPYFADDGTGAIAPEKLQAAWKTMETLKSQGLTKSIGVSNYLPEHLEHTVQGASVIPSVNQIEIHPYLPRHKLVAANKKHGIATAAYSPLVPVTKAAPGPLDEYLSALARKYAVSESEILLRWAIDRGVIAITTSGKEQRLSDYLRVATFKLNPAEVKQIEEEGDKKHHRAFWSRKFDDNDRS